MAQKELPPQTVLRQLLDYNPLDGVLYWKPRDASWFEASSVRTAEHTARIWNKRYSGKAAFTAFTADGYAHGHLLGVSYRAHRIIWKVMTGETPDQIDHIDGDRGNNRWDNLRCVTLAENAKNYKRRADNTSGVIGVSWYPHGRKTGKWLVKISNQHVGLFDTLEDAVTARRAAESENGYHANHGRVQ